VLDASEALFLSRGDDFAADYVQAAESIEGRYAQNLHTGSTEDTSGLIGLGNLVVEFSN
jgi:hypothetical protein